MTTYSKEEGWIVREPYKGGAVNGALWFPLLDGVRFVVCGGKDVTGSPTN